MKKGLLLIALIGCNDKSPVDTETPFSDSGEGDTGSVPVDDTDETGLDETTEDVRVWYLDYDQDGFGADGKWTQVAVDQPNGFVDNDEDCDDTADWIYPGADEHCDLLDEDCDDRVDEDPVDGETVYADTDDDGYGDADITLQVCSETDGWVYNDTDPDDSDPATPGVLRGDWPTHGGNPAHTGYFEGSVGDALLSEGWTMHFGDALLNPVAVSDGIVYLSTDGYFDAVEVVALDADDGSELWSYNFPGMEEPFSLNPPTYYDGGVYVQRGNHSGDTHLWCLDAADGSVVWRSPHSAQWERYLAPTAAEGMVWVNGGTYGGMYGFDAYDGAELFYQSLEQYDEWAPAYDDGVVYSFVEGNVRAHDPESGEVDWGIDVGWDWSGYAMNTAPVVSFDTLVVAGNPNLHAIDITTGREIWWVEGNFEGTPSIAHGLVYAIDSGAVESFSLVDGTYDGIFVGDSQLIGQPIVTDDVLITYSYYNTYIYDLDGVLLETIGYGGAVSLSDGVLYITTPDGDIVTYKWEPSL